MTGKMQPIFERESVLCGEQCTQKQANSRQLHVIVYHGLVIWLQLRYLHMIVSKIYRIQHYLLSGTFFCPSDIVVCHLKGNYKHCLKCRNLISDWLFYFFLIKQKFNVSGILWVHPYGHVAAIQHEMHLCPYLKTGKLSAVHIQWRWGSIKGQ